MPVSADVQQKLLNQEYDGQLAIKNSHNLFLQPNFERKVVQYSNEPFSWKISKASSQATKAYTIYAQNHGSKLYWRINMNNPNKNLVLNDGNGNSDGFIFVRNLKSNDKYSIKSFTSGKYVCCESSQLGGNIVVNRDAAAEWEAFEFIQSSTTENVQELILIPSEEDSAQDGTKFVDDNLTEGNDGNLYVLLESEKRDYVCSKCHKVSQTLYALDNSVICEGCKLMLPSARKRDEFAQVRLSSLKIICPNRVNGCDRGSSNPFPLAELSSHRAVCKYEIISCEFQDLGCNDKLPRVHMAEHVFFCKFRTNADVTRFFKETKAGQEELKQKGSQLLSEVDLLKTKIKQQDDTIKDLQAKLEKVLKSTPKNDDPYWENASSRFNGFMQLNLESNNSLRFYFRCMGGLDTEEIDYNVDPQMFFKILDDLKHNDKVKRVYLSIREFDFKSYPESGIKSDLLPNTDIYAAINTPWNGQDKLGKGSYKLLDELVIKLAELIECNSRITNIKIGMLGMYHDNTESWPKLGEAISKNLVLEELSFPVWAPDNAKFFHALAPFIKKNRKNGGKFNCMSFWLPRKQGDPNMKSEYDQFQMLLKYQL